MAIVNSEDETEEVKTVNIFINVYTWINDAVFLPGKRKLIFSILPNTSTPIVKFETGKPAEDPIQGTDVKKVNSQVYTCNTFNKK